MAQNSYRSNLIRWLINAYANVKILDDYCQYSIETLLLGISLIDAVILSRQALIKTHKMISIASVCLWIASKFEEGDSALTIADVEALTANRIDGPTITYLEVIILKAVGYRIWKKSIKLCFDHICVNFTVANQLNCYNSIEIDFAKFYNYALIMMIFMMYDVDMVVIEPDLAAAGLFHFLLKQLTSYDSSVHTYVLPLLCNSSTTAFPKIETINEQCLLEVSNDIHIHSIAMKKFIKNLTNTLPRHKTIFDASYKGDLIQSRQANKLIDHRL